MLSAEAEDNLCQIHTNAMGDCSQIPRIGPIGLDKDTGTKSNNNTLRPYIGMCGWLIDNVIAKEG